MPHTPATCKFLQDVAMAYDVIKKTLARAEPLLKQNPARGLSEKILELRKTKNRMERQASYYGLDLKNPVYAGMGLGMGPILPLAVIANIGLSNVLSIMKIAKNNIPVTTGMGIQMIMGGLLIGLLIPLAVRGFQKE